MSSLSTGCSHDPSASERNDEPGAEGTDFDEIAFLHAVPSLYYYAVETELGIDRWCELTVEAMKKVSGPESAKVKALRDFLQWPEFREPDFDITKHTMGTFLDEVKKSWEAASSSKIEVVKIIVFGHQGVGKSNLVLRYFNSCFIENYDPTIEDYYRKLVVVDGLRVLVSALDTGRAEIWVGIYADSIAQADGFIVVYDITNRDYYDGKSDSGIPNCVDDFICDIRTNSTQKHSRIILCGNKCDLHANRKVQTAEGQKKADEIGCQFFETSGKTGENVEEVFTALIRQCLNTNTNLCDDETQGRKKENKCILM